MQGADLRRIHNVVHLPSTLLAVASSIRPSTATVFVVAVPSRARWRVALRTWAPSARPRRRRRRAIPLPVLAAHEVVSPDDVALDAILLGQVLLELEVGVLPVKRDPLADGVEEALGRALSSVIACVELEEDVAHDVAVDVELGASASLVHPSARCPRVANDRVCTLIEEVVANLLHELIVERRTTAIFVQRATLICVSVACCVAFHGGKKVGWETNVRFDILLLGHGRSE